MEKLPKGGPLYFIKENDAIYESIRTGNDRKTNEIIVNVKQEFTGVTKEYSPTVDQRNYLNILTLIL